jgi:hypothetical protein
MMMEMKRAENTSCSNFCLLDKGLLGEDNDIFIP